MLPSRMGLAALAAAAAVLAPSALAADSVPSTFVSPDSAVAFSISVPDDTTTDIFFSIRAQTKRAWAAIGLGSTEMAGSLILMIYPTENGQNVTFSPRLVYGNYEPRYWSTLEHEVISTHVDEDYMTFTARCIGHCQSWPARNTNRGFLDTSSSREEAIYAVGPVDWNFGSDDPSVGVAFHEMHGTFNIDIGRTRGAKDAPVMNDTSQNTGATLVSSKTDKPDWRPIVHGTFMLLAFLLVLPLGVWARRLARFNRFHPVIQSIGYGLAMIGLALGVYASKLYQRSLHFNSYHQIIGFLIIFFLQVQLFLGIYNRREFNRTKVQPKGHTSHRWLGRILIFFGAVNALFGFGLAINRRWSWVVVASVAIWAFATVAYLMLQRRVRNQRLAGQFAGPPQGPPRHPWREGPRPPRETPGYPSDAPPGYEPASNQDIDLQPMSPWRSGGNAKDMDEDAGVGTVQQPREFT